MLERSVSPADGDRSPAKLSHELRGAVSGILGWVWLLRRHAHEPERLLRTVDQLEQTARSLERIADGLGTVARAQHGDCALDLRALALSPLVAAAIDRVRDAATAKRVTLELADVPGCTIRGDAAGLARVLDEVLRNAVQFAPIAGRVQLEVRSDKAAADIVVRDSGDGIRREVEARLFEPFNPAADGLGLGLAVVARVVKAHGGAVLIGRGCGGWGTTLVIRLPHAPDLADAQLRSLRGSEGGGRAAVALPVHPGRSDCTRAPGSEFDAQRAKPFDPQELIETRRGGVGRAPRSAIVGGKR